MCAEPVKVDLLGAGKRAERGDGQGGGSSQRRLPEPHVVQGRGECQLLGVVRVPAPDVIQEAATDGKVVLGLGKPGAVA